MRDSTADGAFGGSAVDGSLNSVWSNGPDDSATGRHVRPRWPDALSSVSSLIFDSLVPLVSMTGGEWDWDNRFPLVPMCIESLALFFGLPTGLGGNLLSSIYIYIHMCVCVCTVRSACRSYLIIKSHISVIIGNHSTWWANKSSN